MWPSPIHLSTRPVRLGTCLSQRTLGPGAAAMPLPRSHGLALISLPRNLAHGDAPPEARRDDRTRGPRSRSDSNGSRSCPDRSLPCARLPTSRRSGRPNSWRPSSRPGSPSCAEVTDADAARRAECVMLNKGPYTLETIAALDDILARMGEVQRNCRTLMRRIPSRDSHLPRRFVWLGDRRVTRAGAGVAGGGRVGPRRCLRRFSWVLVVGRLSRLKRCGSVASGVDQGVPRPVPREAQVSSSLAVDDASGDGEDSETEPFGFPPAGGFGVVEGEGLGPGEQVGGQGDDLDPEPVLGEAGER